jgi:hypothetical protein
MTMNNFYEFLLRQCHHFYKTKILRIDKSNRVVENECLQNTCHQKRVSLKIGVVENGRHQKHV